jgi:hypothetical protein
MITRFFLGLTELQWAYLIISTLLCMISSMVSFWLGIQKGIDFMARKVYREEDEK